MYRIDFYVLQAFLDLKLLFQGTFSLLQRLCELKYETLSRELLPRAPAALTNFVSQKMVYT